MPHRLSNAACKGNGNFTSKERPSAMMLDLLRKICNKCPCSTDCLEEALHDEYQIYVRGGLTAGERVVMKWRLPHTHPDHPAFTLYQEPPSDEQDH